MALRGIRGATTVDENTREEILSKTEELLRLLVVKNSIKVEDIASAFFSLTDDLNAEFPAVAARALGWTYTPLFCQKEVSVPGSLEKCVRVLLHVNSDKAQQDMVHLYMGGAVALRPDIADNDAV